MQAVTPHKRHAAHQVLLKALAKDDPVSARAGSWRRFEHAPRRPVDTHHLVDVGGAVSQRIRANVSATALGVAGTPGASRTEKQIRANAHHRARYGIGAVATSGGTLLGTGEGWRGCRRSRGRGRRRAGRRRWGRQAKTHPNKTRLLARRPRQGRRFPGSADWKTAWLYYVAVPRWPILGHRACVCRLGEAEAAAAFTPGSAENIDCPNDVAPPRAGERPLRHRARSGTPIAGAFDDHNMARDLAERIDGTNGQARAKA